MVGGGMSDSEKEIIRQMRLSKRSYKEIAETLNCKVDRIKKYCQRNGLGGFLAPTMKSEALSLFLSNLNKNHGEKFEYVSDYTHSDSLVKVRCKVCNQASEKNAAFARKNKDSICIHCERVKHEQNRKQCIVQGLRARILRESEKPTRAVKEVVIRRCKECFVVYKVKRKGSSYCSAKCANKIANRRKDLSRRNKLKNNGYVDKDITLSEVVRVEKNICYLCNKECNGNDYTINDEGHFVVGKDYPSIEHIIPVSKGGTHTWDNVRLAHHYCNTIKSDKETEMNTGQLEMIF